MMLTRIWREQPGDWFFISTKSSSGKWHDEPFAADMLHMVRDYVDAQSGKDVYACPHGFRRPVRTKEYAVLPRLLWADLDGVDPHELELEPTIALESSPGRYVGLWQTDRVVTEQLNQRLTYHLGADRGGWDLSQVLRLVPRTINYKYADEPKVRLLWRDGPAYRVKELERELPKLVATAKTIPAKRSAVGDWRKLATKFRLNAKMRQRPCATDRSSLIWYLGKSVLERNGSVDEALTIVRHSAAFKFKYADDALGAEREIERLRRKWSAQCVRIAA